MTNKLWSKGDKFSYKGNIFAVTGVDVQKYYQSDFTRTFLRFSNYKNRRDQQLCWVDDIEVTRSEKKYKSRKK